VAFWISGIVFKMMPCLLLTLFVWLLTRILNEVKQNRMRLLKGARPPPISPINGYVPSNNNNDSIYKRPPSYPIKPDPNSSDGGVIGHRSSNVSNNFVRNTSLKYHQKIYFLNEYFVEENKVVGGPIGRHECSWSSCAFSWSPSCRKESWPC